MYTHAHAHTLLTVCWYSIVSRDLPPEVVAPPHTLAPLPPESVQGDTLTYMRSTNGFDSLFSVIYRAKHNRLNKNTHLFNIVDLSPHNHLHNNLHNEKPLIPH